MARAKPAACPVALCQAAPALSVGCLFVFAVRGITDRFGSQPFNAGRFAGGTFTVSGIRFERHPIGDLVKPATHRFALGDGTGLAHQRQKGRLEGIFRILFVAQEAPAQI